MAAEIEIEIDKAGKVTMRPKGVKGKNCKRLADLMAQIVGRELSRTNTAEAYETAEEDVVTRQEVQQHRK